MLTVAEIPSKIARLDFKIAKVDLHRHLEGSLFAKTIQEIAIKYGVGFEEDTINKMDDIVKEGMTHRTLLNFISLLSTRWMKLVITKIMVEKDFPESKNEVKACVRTFVETIMQHAHNIEGLEVMNLLISPLNLSVNGDLSSGNQPILDPTSPIKPTAEEVTYYGLWNEKIKNSELITDGITWKEYLEIIGETRQRFEDQYQMRIFTTCSLRRDSDFKFLTDRKEMLQRVNDLWFAFKEGWIDFVDICGDETDPRFLLRNYTEFLELLSYYQIPFSVHLAELKYKTTEADKKRFEDRTNPEEKITQRNAAYQNVDTALNHLSARPVIAAHAVRIADQINSIKNMFSTMYSPAPGSFRIPIAMNVGSNIMTGIFPEEEMHRLLLFFLDPANEDIATQVLIMLCTDDPVITDTQPNQALANEVNKVEKAVKNIRQRFNWMTGTDFMQLLESKLKDIVEQLDGQVTNRRIESSKIIELTQEEFKDRTWWRNAV